MKEYKVRFNALHYVDIIVNAENEEEAYELANEFYNEGKWEGNEVFENTTMEIIY